MTFSIFHDTDSEIEYDRQWLLSVNKLVYTMNHISRYAPIQIIAQWNGPQQMLATFIIYYHIDMLRAVLSQALNQLYEMSKKAT